jgi:hypothetical protein
MHARIGMPEASIPASLTKEAVETRLISFYGHPDIFLSQDIVS